MRIRGALWLILGVLIGLVGAPRQHVSPAMSGGEIGSNVENLGI